MSRRVAWIPLVGSLAMSTVVYPQEMTNDEARQICDDVARLESEHRLDPFVIELSRLPTATPTSEEAALIEEQLVGENVLDTARLEVAPGKSILFANTLSSGSCANYSISPIVPPPAGEPEGEALPGPEVGTGGKDQIVRRNGRYFIVSRWLGSGMLHDLAWVTPEGAVQPMCSFESQRDIRKSRVHQAPRALCDELLDAPSSVEWKGYEEFDWKDPAVAREVREVAFLAPADEDPELETARVDVDNDGTVDDLIRLTYSSGSGCGFSGSRLQILDPVRRRIQVGALNDALQMQSLDRHAISIVSAGGRHYVVAENDSEGVVSSISAKGAVAQCAFDNHHVMRVSRMYPLRKAKP